MKKIVLTLAAALVCGGAFTFTSCSGNASKGDATEQTENDAVAQGRERVQKTLDQFTGQLPQSMGAGLTLEKLAIDGDYVVYTIAIEDADIYNELEIDDEAKNAALQNIGAAGKTFVDAKLGARFVYTNKDSKSDKEMSITPEELAKNYSSNAE